jgi:hypothetical protein
MLNDLFLCIRGFQHFSCDEQEQEHYLNVTSRGNLNQAEEDDINGNGSDETLMIPTSAIR